MIESGLALAPANTLTHIDEIEVVTDCPAIISHSAGIQSGEALLSEDHCGGTDVFLPSNSLKIRVTG